MRTRILLANVLAVTLLASTVFALVVRQRDRAALQPATEDQITEYRLDFARKKAEAERKFLMVEFGADWCADCRELAKSLNDPGTREYFQNHFNLLRIDIGQSDQNFEAAKTVGLNLNHGIPAVVIFAPDGSRIGATNDGELEPARNYRPAQILAFIKAVVTDRTIINPSTAPTTLR